MDFLTFDSAKVLWGCLAAEEKRRMWMQRPGVALSAEGERERQGEPRSRSCSCCSSAAPPVFHQRPQEWETMPVARDNIPFRTPGEPGNRKRDGPPLPLLLLGLQVCWENLPPGAFLISGLMRRAKAVQGQLWVLPGLLCKVPAAECAQEPGSVQGPRVQSPSPALEKQGDCRRWLSSGSQRS